jgi:hypothetical protein
MNYYAEAMTDYWELGHKVTFDYFNRLIHVAPSVTTLNVKIDLYSDMKEWFKLDNRKNRNFKPPIRVIGGDDTTAGQTAGDIYFMQNGWRVVYDPTKVQVDGVLFSDDFDSPWLYTEAWNLSETLQPVFPALVASLVTGVDIEAVSAPSAPTVAAAVRTELTPELDNMDTTVSSRATQASVDALATALAGSPKDTWDYLLSNIFPAGSTGAKLKQVLTTGNFLALSK